MRFSNHHEVTHSSFNCRRSSVISYPITDNREPTTAVLLATSATGPHPFPSRTRSLSLSAPMVLRSRGRGRVGRRQRLQTECPMFNDRRTLDILVLLIIGH